MSVLATLAPAGNEGGHLLRGLESAGRFLATRPTPAEVCRYLVLHTPWRERARGALLSVCQDDGHLEIVGSFGYPRNFVDAYRRLSLFERTPLSDAVTTETPVIMDGSMDMASTYEQLCQELGGYADTLEAGALLAVPLVSDSGAVGALGMTFADSFQGADASRSQLMSLAPLLAVHLAYVSNNGRASSNGHATSMPLEVPADPAIGLTKRQLRVLHMLAKKMTNQDIATALDYSLSTVRLDTMAIYRVLDVGGRREAVEKAKAMGIIINGS
jgi:DNA-binding NarL/FixJ family response regulator